jgi:hypothetical protein
MCADENLCSAQSCGTQSVALPMRHPLFGNIREFISVITARSHSSNECLLSALHYMRMLRASQRYRITRNTICILYTTCLYLANKFLEDVVCVTRFWSRISGFPEENIVKAESYILLALDWNIFHTAESYHCLFEEHSSLRFAFESQVLKAQAIATEAVPMEM